MERAHNSEEVRGQRGIFLCAEIKHVGNTQRGAY